MIRDTVLLALSLALASGVAGCAVQTVEEGEEDLVAETQAELHEGDGEDELGLEIVAVGSDPSGRDEGMDPEPEPWEPEGGAYDGDGDPPDPGDPYASSDSKSNIK